MIKMMNWQIWHFTSILSTFRYPLIEDLTYLFHGQSLMNSFERHLPLTLRLVGTFSIIDYFDSVDVETVEIKSKSSLRKTAWKVELKMTKVQKIQKDPRWIQISSLVNGNIFIPSVILLLWYRIFSILFFVSNH